MLVFDSIHRTDQSGADYNQHHLHHHIWYHHLKDQGSHPGEHLAVPETWQIRRLLEAGREGGQGLLQELQAWRRRHTFGRCTESSGQYGNQTEGPGGAARNIPPWGLWKTCDYGALREYILCVDPTREAFFLKIFLVSQSEKMIDFIIFRYLRK